jgi:hypothetical protein
MSTALYGEPSSQLSDSDDDYDNGHQSESENQSMLSNSGVNTNLISNSKKASSKDGSSLFSVRAKTDTRKKLD